jgi:hypothetical protein
MRDKGWFIEFLREHEQEWKAAGIGQPREGLIDLPPIVQQ